MLNLKTPTLKNARLLAAAAVAGVALGVAATSFAQDAHAPTDAQVAEHEAMVTAVMKAVLVETDFEAVKAHMTAAIREHAEEIGGDTEATVTHVTEFLDRVAEHAASDPQGAAEFTATMLIEAHRPH